MRASAIISVIYAACICASQWDRKKEIIDSVLNGCVIAGYADSLVEISRLYMYADLRKVLKYLGGMK